MIILNIQVSFIYGWGSLRFIKVFVDDIYHSKILAQGYHLLEVPCDTKKVTFSLGFIKPYITSVYISEQNIERGELFVGLYLHHRSLIHSFFDSLKKDYLRSESLTSGAYKTFAKDIYKQEMIVLTDRNIGVLTLILSIFIFIFSIVQQKNEWASLAFLLSLSSIISTLVYFKENLIEKVTFKIRTLTSVASFILCALFLENSFPNLRFIIILFTLLLFLFYLKEIKNKNQFN